LNGKFFQRVIQLAATRRDAQASMAMIFLLISFSLSACLFACLLADVVDVVDVASWRDLTRQLKNTLNSIPLET